jgi:hypothetical protein
MARTYRQMIDISRTGRPKPMQGFADIIRQDFEAAVPVEDARPGMYRRRRKSPDADGGSRSHRPGWGDRGGDVPAAGR